MTKGETLYYDFAFANQPAACSTPRSTRQQMAIPPFIDVDLEVPDSSLGNELQIRVVGADCSQGGHGGYVYVDAFGSVSIPPQGACVNDLQLRAKPGNVQLTWADTAPPAMRSTAQTSWKVLLCVWAPRSRATLPAGPHGAGAKNLLILQHPGAGCGWPCAVQLWRGSDLCACALECGRPVNRPPIFTTSRACWGCAPTV
ncbi:hypothetical protein [Comamonas sp. JC664]|uniref:hypothetical protein n=1 Tax=Comamonas sp. JC664 TaxID=2801917 RepID=UPI003623820A